MTGLVLWTYDWVPEPPSGLARDLCVRWALTTPFSAADFLMADVLRMVDRFDGLADHPTCHAYRARRRGRRSRRRMPIRWRISWHTELHPFLPSKLCEETLHTPENNFTFVRDVLKLNFGIDCNRASQWRANA